MPLTHPPSDSPQDQTVRSAWLQRLGIFAGLMLVACIPMSPAILAGHHPSTHEGLRYEQFVAFFLDAQSHGYLYPRWLPDLAGGFGYPTFVFYQPFYFFVAAALEVVLRTSPVMAVQYASAAFALAGASGAYALARGFLPNTSPSNAIAALACAALFVMTPYCFSDLYVRGDHSEFAATMLTPWPLVGLMRAAARFGTRRAILPLLGSAIALSLIIATHPMTGLFFVPLSLAIAIAAMHVVTRGLRLRWLVAIAAVGAIAIAIASPYWFPVFQTARYVRLGNVSSDAFNPAEHMLEFWRFFARGWSFGTAGMPSRGIPINMSFQIGLPHFIVAAMGLILGRRNRWVVASAIAYALLIPLMMPIAAPVWVDPSPLRIVQFPWRLLGILAPLGALLSAAALAGIAPKSPTTRALIAWGSVALAAGWYWPMFDTSPALQRFSDGTSGPLPWSLAEQIVTDEAHVSGIYPGTFALMNEFGPLTAPSSLTAKRVGPLLLAAGRIDFSPSSSSYFLDATVASDGPQQATIQQLLFPGWRVEVNGRRLPDNELDHDALGRIVISLPTGTSHVVAYYDGPRYWLGRSIVAILAAAAGATVVVLVTRERSLTPRT